MTAVEWLVDKLKLESIDLSKWHNNLIKQSKEMEKEQTERAFNESRLTHPMIGFKHETFEDYWNEINFLNK